MIRLDQPDKCAFCGRLIEPGEPKSGRGDAAAHISCADAALADDRFWDRIAAGMGDASPAATQANTGGSEPGSQGSDAAPGGLAGGGATAGVGGTAGGATDGAGGTAGAGGKVAGSGTVPTGSKAGSGTRSGCLLPALFVIGLALAATGRGIRG